MNNLTHVRKLQDPNYLGAYELITDWTPDGKAVSIEKTITILKVVNEVVKTQKATSELVVYFEECKPMIVNVVNRDSIIKVVGSPMDGHWIGKKITVYVERIFDKRQKQWIDAIRVRDTAPVAKKPELTPSHEKWEGARKAILEQNTTIEAIKSRFDLSAENEKLLCTNEN